MSSGHRLDLISSGKSAYRIAISPKAAEPEVFAAAELQRYLRLMTGVEAPITERARGGRLMRIGGAANAHLPRNAGEDAFVVRTDGDALILAGATLYAVYSFLEDDLGCAWLSPGDEHVPETDAVSVTALRRVERPDFTSRMIVHFPCPAPRTRGQIDWMAKRRLSESLLATNNNLTAWENGAIPNRVLPELRRRGLKARATGHAFMAWLPAERYAKAHPEYYALVDGVRRTDLSLCISHPAVAREVAANIGAFADRYPLVERVTIWHNDHSGWCQCPTCREWLATPAEQYEELTWKGRRPGRKSSPSRTAAELRFVNRVADALKRTHPRLTLETLAYGANYAPTAAVAPRANVASGFAQFDKLLVPEWGSEPVFGGAPGLRVPAKYVAGWRERSARLYIYEYYGFFHDFSPIWDAMRADFRDYLRRGIHEIGTECGTWNDLHMYLFSRLAWNSRASLDALLGDWCRGAYGPAAEPMTQFWQGVRRTDLGWNFGALAAKQIGVKAEEWDAARRRSTKWVRADKRSLALLNEAICMLSRSPLILRFAAASADPRALDRVRKLRARWTETPLPWWKS